MAAGLQRGLQPTGCFCSVGFQPTGCFCSVGFQPTGCFGKRVGWKPTLRLNQRFPGAACVSRPVFPGPFRSRSRADTSVSQHLVG